MFVVGKFSIYQLIKIHGIQRTRTCVHKNSKEIFGKKNTSKPMTLLINIQTYDDVHKSVGCWLATVAVAGNCFERRKSR